MKHFVVPTLLLAIAACAPNGGPAVPGATASPRASAAPDVGSSSTPAATERAVAQGGFLHLTLSNVETTELTDAKAYEAMSVLMFPVPGPKSVGFGIPKANEDRNYVMSLTDKLPKAGEVYKLGTPVPTDSDLRGSLQYAQRIPNKGSLLWLAESGTITIDKIEGATVDLTVKDAVMAPQNTGGTNNVVPTGKFTVNGTGRVDKFLGL